MARPAPDPMADRLAGATVGWRVALVAGALLLVTPAPVFAAGPEAPVPPGASPDAPPDAPMPNPCAMAPTLPFCPRGSP